ncbi:ankyrin repeat domain-containing protein [Streptomyces sp. SID5785]|uniref:ankyrin repeat domain-containing protein n=1 Tax=Streptomyces sp. SID5785 TaxID=2690309 RepID=UPI001F31742A|nr:ankyrin repeat domain-containing protein [Streptomyces sp. SID5785]
MDDKGMPDGSALFDAVLSGDEDAVVRLLRAGVPGEVRDEDGESALYRAAMCDEPGIVRLLLAAGADPDGLSCGTDLPLCGAACGGHVAVVRALLGAGARVDAVEEGGFRAMTWAVQLGRAPVVRALLDGGADPGLPDAKGEYPLVAAARRGSADCVRALLGCGAPGGEQALAEARRWIGVDVAARLRAGLAATSPQARDREAITQRFAEDGGVTVSVQLLDETGRPTTGNEQQTGHAAIATLLERSLGIRAPAAELANRAVRSGDPDGDDWTEARGALRERADELTFRAAAAWCADRDPLRRAFAADVLAGLGPAPGPFTPRALPLLRQVLRAATPTGSPSGSPSDSPSDSPGGAARRAARPDLRCAVGALGTLGVRAEPVSFAELAPFADHPDPGVRQALAVALPGFTAVGTAEALATATHLCSDPDPTVRSRSAAALADAAAVTDAGGVADAGAVESAGAVAAAEAVTDTGAVAGPGAVTDAGAVAGPGAVTDAGAVAGPGAVKHVGAVTDTGTVADPGAVAGPGAAADADAVESAGPAGRRGGGGAALLDTLAWLLDDPVDEVAAEAARGLAVRQDPRAVEPLARLLALAPPGSHAHDLAQEAARACTDARTRTRLEWTLPRTP